MGKNEKKNKGNKGKTNGNRKNSLKDKKNKKGNKGKTSANRKNSQKDENRKKGNPSDGDRKFVKKPSKKPSAENDAKLIKRLNKLGFTKMPTKSTKDGLDCMWSKLENLLVKCGEKILSNT